MAFSTEQKENCSPLHSVWKSPTMSHLNFLILAFSTNFCPIKTDLPGNAVWPQTLGFQKLAKLDHFWHFELTFVHSKGKRSSLRSQCWRRLFLWFTNTVPLLSFRYTRFVANQTETVISYRDNLTVDTIEKQSLFSKLHGELCWVFVIFVPLHFSQKSS